MKNKWAKRLGTRNTSESGAVIVMVAIVLIALIAIMALAVDVGYLLAGRNELQNVADAAALAATGKLGNIYKGLSTAESNDYTATSSDVTAINDVALGIAKMNKAGNVEIDLRTEDIMIGTWNPGRKPDDPFVAGLVRPDAVRVIARRDGLKNTAFATFFAKIFGIDSADISATATAALTGPADIVAGGLVLPIGLPTVWFTNKEEYCHDNLKFNPTKDPEGCTGWHTYTETPSSASELDEIMWRMLPPDQRFSVNEKGKVTWHYENDPGYTSPPVQFGSSKFSFTGGTTASVFEPFYYLWKYFKDHDAPDTRTDTWVANVVVYDYANCDNPNKQITIVGLAQVEITAVAGPSTKTVVAQVDCNSFKEFRGSGNNYGVKGTIPGLVQ